MNSLKSLIERYRRNGLLIDTNLLLLFFIGLFDTQKLSSFKCVQKFTVDDYLLLVEFSNRFERIVTTPNILTEVSNLSGQVNGKLKQNYFATFATKIDLLDECYVQSTEVGRAPEFVQFGITDVGIQQLANKTYLVLTDDFRLSQYLQSQSIDTINFAHLQNYEW